MGLGFTVLGFRFTIQAQNLECWRMGFQGSGSFMQGIPERQWRGQ